LFIILKHNTKNNEGCDSVTHNNTKQMKEDLKKYVEQLEIERQANTDVYSEETLNRLDNLIKEYHKLILSL